MPRYCPSCHDEFRDEVISCPDCHVRLVGELAVLVPLAELDAPEGLSLLLDRLEGEAVPYIVQAGTALRLLDEEGAELSAPDPWQARVWVRAADGQRAADLAEGIREGLVFPEESPAAWKNLDRHFPR